MSHFSTSLSSPDSSDIPCGAHLVGFPCLCFSQSLLSASPKSYSSSPLSFFIASSLYLSFSLRQSTHAKSSCSEQRCLLMKTQGKCSGNCFHFVKDGAILFLCVRHDQAQLFAQFNTKLPYRSFFLSLFFHYSFAGTVCTVIICLLLLIRWNGMTTWTRVYFSTTNTILFIVVGQRRANRTSATVTAVSKPNPS